MTFVESLLSLLNQKQMSIYLNNCSIRKLTNSHRYDLILISREALPETRPETVRRVITPRVTRAGTQSISIQNETHDIATIKIEGK